jgi:SAM-dependent methyltransferase
MGCAVRALDASGSACTILRERLARSSPLPGSVQVDQGVLNVTDVPEGQYDLILDSYVSCHILSDYDRMRYLETLISHLRPGGVLYTAAMGSDDSYYRTHIVGCDGGLPISSDPLNGVAKLLQTRTSYPARLGDLAPVSLAVVELFDDVVGAGTYAREVLAAAVRRPR